MLFVERKLFASGLSVVGFYVAVMVLGYLFGDQVPMTTIKFFGYISMWVIVLSMFGQAELFFNAIPGWVTVLIFAVLPFGGGRMLAERGVYSAEAMLGISGLIALVLMVTYIFWLVYSGSRKGAVR